MQIQVLGAGSWGLALARLLANNGHDVRLWCRDADHPDMLRNERRSPFYLQGITLPDSIIIDTEEINYNAEIAVLAVPSHVMRHVASNFVFSPNTIRVSVAKGIENETLMRMSQVIHSVSPEGPVVALSGPSHAEEVAAGLPASLVAAGENEDACKCIQEVFMADSFRVYTSPDIIGVEFGGALKNVIAIAAGASDGMGLGDNAKAALMTRGLAEISRLGVSEGADPLTFAGLSGMGDLIVTCTSQHSRNRRVGERLSSGEPLDVILSDGPMVAEGVRTARSATYLARKNKVEMPITEITYGVLYESTIPSDAIDILMQRGARPEADH